MKALTGGRLKKAARALVLGAFAILLALGRLGFWAIAFGLGLIMEAVKPGRLYCLWLCPIRAAHGLAGRGSAANTKKGSPRRGAMSIKTLGRAFISAFLVLFGISLALGLRGWLFPAFVALGTILSFALSLQTLCSSFCPFGAAFVLVRRISGRIPGLARTASPIQSEDGRAKRGRLSQPVPLDLVEDGPPAYAEFQGGLGAVAGPL